MSSNLWVFYLRCSTGKLAVSTSQLPFGMTCGIAWYQDRFFPVSEAWSCWAKTRKHSEREPGPKKPASLQSTDPTRLVRFEAKMLVTTSPLVRCTLLFHFQCCQGLSIFSDKQQPQAETFSWQIHSNKEPSVTIEPWWKDFWKSWSWHYRLHFTLKTVRILLGVKTPPLLDEKMPPPEILLFWLFTRKISPHGVSKTLSRRYLNSTESPVPVVTQASTE